MIFDARNRTVATRSCPRRAPTHPHAHACCVRACIRACVCVACARLDGRGYGLTILSFLLVSLHSLPPLRRIGIARAARRGAACSSRVVGARGSERFAVVATRTARRERERTRGGGGGLRGAGPTEDERTGGRGREKERGRVSRVCLT